MSERSREILKNRGIARTQRNIEQFETLSKDFKKSRQKNKKR